MDLLRVSGVVLLSVLSTCSGKNFRGSRIFFTDTDRAERIPQCPYENKPCMIMVRDFHSNGSLRQEFRSSTICRCGRGVSCSSVWENDQDRTVTRYLHTRGSVMTFQLKFCNPVLTERICAPHEVALTLTGRSIMTQEVTSVNCRCANNEPLYKRTVWYERFAPNVRNENYVCDMPDCANGNVPCHLSFRNTTRRATTFLCKCTGEMQCRNAGQFAPRSRYRLGNCMNVA